MIPKKIHYCWLGEDEIPKMQQKCMATWKEILPDYELVLWNQKKIDINSVNFVKEAVNAKKWAFAADYIRLYAIYTEGGIYLDMDVIVKRNFDVFLKHDFFSAIELMPQYLNSGNEVYVYEDGSVVQKVAGITMQAAIMGGVAGNKFLLNCLEWYKNKHFILQGDSLADRFLAPYVYATIAQRYGFRYKNEEQDLASNMKIYPSSLFASNIFNLSKDNYAVHCCAGGWRKKTFLNQLVTGNNLIRKLFGRPPKIKPEDMYHYVQNSSVWK